MTGGGRGTGTRREAGRFGLTWWGQAWVEALEQRAQLDPNRLPRGTSYARSGSVGDLVIGPGEVRATVEGRLEEPYEVRIRVRTFDDSQWSRVLDAIATQVAHVAALLEGQLPAEVAADVADAGLSLLPGPGEIGPRCTCPDPADPCKHSAAACYLVAEALDADPFLVLLLRGRTQAEVLAGLRVRRQGPSGPGTDPDGPAGDDSGPGDAGTPDPVPGDDGLDAREVFAAAGTTSEPPLPPAPPLPPRRPGRPVALPLDPPPELGSLRSDLAGLAADAAHRAWELATGASDDAWLGLDPDADLARRADVALGTAAFARLAARCGVPERELARRALAWRHGGVHGYRTLAGGWDPAVDGEAGTAQLLRAAREAVREATGVEARLRRDRVTAAALQLRLGRDYRWYPYRRIRRDWEPAGTPDADPAVALGALRRPTA